jgi:hypothetical protein
MNKKYYLILVIMLCWLKPTESFSQDEAQDKIEDINFSAKKSSYINFIDSYVAHINKASKDSDSFSKENYQSINAKKGFKFSTTKKRVIYRNNDIVKTKYVEVLDHNFIKLKSFYYQNNKLIYIKINELLPTKTDKIRNYQRTLYFHNNELLLDSNKNDKKYNSSILFHLGEQKLQDEYQSSIND